MPMSDEYHHANALEAALEWMLFRLVATSSNPKEVVADFEKHMKDREEYITQFANKKLVECNFDTDSNDFNTSSNAMDSVFALEKVRENLVNSVTISS